MDDKIPNERVWHTPVKAYSDYLALAAEVGTDAINRLNKYQKVRETKALAILCFAMYMRMGTPWFLQLDEGEKTDGRIMRLSPTQKGDLELLRVEHTAYRLRNDGKLPDDSLLDQLKRTKALGEKHRYDEHTLVLIDQSPGFTKKTGVDHEAIAAYLKSIHAPYQVWSIEEIQAYPDSIARINLYTPRFHQLDLNVGEAAFKQRNNNIRGSLTVHKADDPQGAGIILPSLRPVTRPVWDFGKKGKN